MIERQILFSGEMARAILEGRKYQTRRVVRLANFFQSPCGFYFRDRRGTWNNVTMAALIGQYCPYGVPGDRLWVRETWAIAREYDHLSGSQIPKFSRSLLKILYLDDGLKPEWAGRTRASRFMPHWASRITLEVVKVRVERVQSISHNDACVEGAPSEPELNDFGTGSIYVDWYAQLWDKINAKRGYGWEVNPWVWVVEFEKVEGDEHAI